MVGRRLGSAGGRDRFEPAVVARLHADLVAGRAPPVGELLRDEVAESWRLSIGSVSPDLAHAPVDDDAPARWSDGPAAHAFELVRDELVQIASDGDFVAAVTDAEGAIVWMVGGRTMRRRAEAVGFLPGGRWDEAAVGTNALGLALRTGRPSAVRATEHFAPMVHDWVCYSAPIADPAGGPPLGVLDLSTTWSRANPLALSTVAALAKNLELCVAAAGPHRRDPSLRVEVLGSDTVRLADRRLDLPPRQIELLTVLSLHPGGLRLEELHDRVHGESPVSPSTTKAELSHLRRRIGSALASRPYRLEGSWSADHVEVLAALRAGDVDAAVAAYRGPLLPRSVAPSVEEHRHVIAMAVRSAVIAAPTPARLAALRSAMPDDPYLAELADAG